MIKINGHGHLLPNPDQIPHFLKKNEIFWVSEDKLFMHQKDWRRPITDPSFFLDNKILWMAEHGIHHEVLLTLSQLYCNGLSKNMTADVIRFQNDFHAQVQKGRGDLFTCGFVVQPLYISQALKEIERCVHDLHLSLLCLPTHYLDESEQWTSVADPRVEPIFELANELNLAVEIHPYDAPRMINLKDQFWRFHLVWMCAQTADTYHFFTLLDFPNRYPNVRTCFAHGNQFGQVNVGRRKQGYEGRPDLFKDTCDPETAIDARNVFYDTLVHDLLSFELLIRRQGIEYVIAGLDDPYPLGEMSNVPHSHPGKVIDQAVASGLITVEDKKEIWSNNVLRWIGGSRSKELKNLFNLN